jgi:hypothetical protein
MDLEHGNGPARAAGRSLSGWGVGSGNGWTGIQLPWHESIEKVSMTIEEAAKILDRLTDVVLVIAKRVDWLDGDMSEVLHELACIKQSLGTIDETNRTVEK